MRSLSTSPPASYETVLPAVNCQLDLEACSLTEQRMEFLKGIAAHALAAFRLISRRRQPHRDASFSGLVSASNPACPLLIKGIGTQPLLYILVGTSLLGALITWAFRIETKGVNLEKVDWAGTRAQETAFVYCKKPPLAGCARGRVCTMIGAVILINFAHRQQGRAQWIRPKSGS